MNFKRLSLNLLHYYQDYRQLSRICIKDDINTIGDLEKQIALLFDIKGTFYLMSNNFYLPSFESIQLLDDNDLVGVIPNCDYEEGKESEENVVILKKKTIKSKSKDRVEKFKVVEPSREKKREQNNNLETNEEEKSESGTEDRVPRAKKKKFKKNNICMEELEDGNGDNIEKNKRPQKHLDVTIENTDKVKKSKKKYFVNIQTEAEIYTTSTDNELYKEEAIKVPIENYDKEEKIRKRRRCITPKKSSNSGVSNTNGNDETKTEVENDDENMEISLPTPTKLIDNKEKHSEIVETSCEVTDFESPNNSKNNSRRSVFKEHKNSLGIGNVLQFLSAENSVNESDNDSCIQSENNFVTKRRRCRVRHRKKKEKPNEKEGTPETPIFKPPKTKAAPKSHIKFTDDKIEDFNESNISLFQSTPLKVDMERKVVVSQPDLILNKIKMSFRNLDVSKYPNLTDVPSVNSLIIFKRLKLGENYEPVISNYILAEVNEVLDNGEELKITIIDGLMEFKEPCGRFTCNLEEEENVLDDIIIIKRTELLDLKLFQSKWE